MRLTVILAGWEESMEDRGKACNVLEALWHRR
jgi:hypothetical protein